MYLSDLKRKTPLEVRIVPEVVALTMRTPDKALDIEQAINSSLSKYLFLNQLWTTKQSFLALWQYLDLDSSWAATLAPAPEGMGNELGSIVTVEVHWSRVETGEIIQHYYHALGFSPPPFTGWEAKTPIDHLSCKAM